MSLKDSMIRGLALSGMDAIARRLQDVRRHHQRRQQGRSLNLANNPVHEIA